MKARTILQYIQWTSLGAGLALLMWPAYVTAESALVQRAGAKQFAKASARPKTIKSEPVQNAVPTLPKRGTMLAQFELPRLGLSYVVLEGTDKVTLDKSIGHVEHTAYPGEPGNIAIAGHRNTHFRKLEWVRSGDELLLRSKDSEYRYIVKSARLVSPKDISVLSQSEGPAVTLVTCFPFEYVGAAPLRFIVKALPDEKTLAQLQGRPSPVVTVTAAAGNTQAENASELP